MVEHISCRVPWHDNKWNGCICNNPSNNTSCMRCKAIFESVDKTFEDENAKKSFLDFEDRNKFACIKEGSCFMSDKEITIRTTHPYSTYDDKKYMSHWEWKKQIYAGIGYSEEKGNLIVSRDELNGGINSEKIDEIIKKISM